MSEPAENPRAAATLGVALIAFALLLPFAIVSLVTGELAQAIGTFGIMTILAANALCVTRGLNYQCLTLFGLVPAGMVFMTQVFLHNGMIGTLWCFPSILACYCMLEERRAWAANGIILSIALPMSVVTLDPDVAARVFATLIAVSLFSAIVVRVIDEQQSQLQRQLHHDPLTGLLNRAPLKRFIERAIAKAKTTTATALAQADVPRPVLLALDLDHFKYINDTYGHEAGDTVLVSVSALLRSCTPEQSSVFRLGGEEFLVLLPPCTLARAQQLSEQLCAAVAGAGLVIEPNAVTVSIGVAGLQWDDDWTTWMRRSDQQLYRAKHQGRNRVVCEHDLAEPLTPAIPWESTAVS